MQTLKVFQILGNVLFISSLTACNVVAPPPISATATLPPPDIKRITFHANGVYVINADGTGPVRLTGSGTNPSWSPDGQQIAFVGPGSEIYLMNVAEVLQHKDESVFTRLTNTGDMDTWTPLPVWSPNGRQIAFSSFKNDGTGIIYLINVAEALQGKSSGQIRLNRQGVDAQSITWSPDGRQIAFSYRHDLDAPEDVKVRDPLGP